MSMQSNSGAAATERSKYLPRYRYVQLTRSLKTYGMTFFPVEEQPTGRGKEKYQKKGRLIPMLLGVAKDRIFRLDPKTKVGLAYLLNHTLFAYCLCLGNTQRMAVNSREALCCWG